MPLSLAALNAEAARTNLSTLSGQRLKFVAPTPEHDCSAVAYERLIWETGQVLTRTQGRGACHDGFNALCWLTFPAIRAQLNALQATALDSASADRPSGRRGWLRDRITLFDESGVVLVTRERPLLDALRVGDWEALFVTDRERWLRCARVWVVGHALHEKLVAPYKGVCGRVLVLEHDPDDPIPAIDRAAAAALASRLRDCDSGSAAVGPCAPWPVLPLMGIPGWCSGNVDPAFYRDPLVFRSRKP